MSEELQDDGPSDDEKAGNLGWVNEERWVEMGRDPKDHISSSEFIKKSEENGALAVKNNRTLQKQMHEFQKATVQIHEQMAKQHEREIKALKDQIRQAAEAGDMDTFDKASEELEQQRQNAPKPIQQDTSRNDAAQDFVNRIPNFNSDPILRGAAIALENEIGVTERDPVSLYRKIEHRLRSEFPAKFGATTPKTTVEPSSRPAKKNGKLTFESLPQEDKKMYSTYAKMFAAQGKEYTKDQFMKSYKESYDGE